MRLPWPDRAAVVQFDGTAQTRRELIEFESQVIGVAGICGITTGSGTAVGDAVTAARNELTAHGNEGNVPVIVLLTDGDSHAGVDPVTAACAAKDLGIRVITIGLGNDLEPQVLKDMASPNPNGTDGKDYYAGTTANLPQIYQQIAASLCRGVNQPPVVNAGSDKCAVIPSPDPAVVNLTGSVSDNPSQTLNIRWQLISGPALASVTFANPYSPTTIVEFTSPGIYTLRLTADDGSLTANDDVEVFVFGQSPDPGVMVDAGLPQSIIVGMPPVQLSGKARTRSPACGIPDVQWTVDSPSGVNLTFDPDSDMLNPTVSGFPGPGQYVLKLTATDGTDEVSDTVTITVCNAQELPLDIILLMDTSPSVWPVLPTIKSAASRLVELSDFNIHQGALVTFGDNATMVQPLTHDPDSLKRAIELFHKEVSGYHSEAALGIRLASDAASDPARAKGAFPVIILLSDGWFTHGGWWMYSPEAAIAAAHKAKMTGARIITVMLPYVPHPDPNAPTEEKLIEGMRKVASSDADCHVLNSIDEVGKVYASIAESFCYTPNRRPVVYAGYDRKVDMTGPVSLQGSVYDEKDISTFNQVVWEDTTTPTTPPVGTVTFSPPDGSLTPTASFSAPGTYRLKLTVEDEDGLSSSDEVEVTHGQALYPVAVGDYFSVASYAWDEEPRSTILDVLANDYDPDGDAIRISRISQAPQWGVVEMINNGRSVRYTPPPEYGGGTDSFGYTITDGRDGESDGEFVQLSILPLNHPPTAREDVFYVAAGSVERELNVLRNDQDADLPLSVLRIVSVDSPGAGQGTLKHLDSGPGESRLMYTPPASIATPFDLNLNYSIADRDDSRSTSTLTIHVVQTEPQNQPPTVSLGNDITINSLSPLLTPTVLSSTVTYDGIGTLEYDWGVVSPLNSGCMFVPSSGTYGYPPTVQVWFPTDGTYTLELNVREVYGQNVEIVSDQINVTVVHNDLVAAIQVPGEDAIINEGFLDVRGAADDPLFNQATFSYTLRVFGESPNQDNPDQPILTDTGVSLLANQRVAAAVTPGTLGTLDLTKLENGRYVVELNVVRAPTPGGPVGMSKQTRQRIVLNSPLKLGRFTFSQEDVVLPTGGLPLAVVRSYDSFNSKRGEFGWGWSYSLRDMDVEINEVRDNVDDDDETVNVRIGGGRDVTLTLPNGERTTFLYSLRQGFVYMYAEWVSPPGVFATLTPIGDNRLSGIGTLTWQAGGYHTPYEVYDFPGFVLTMSDGTQYKILREPLGSHFFAGEGNEEVEDGVYVNAYGEAKLRTITRPNGEKIVISDDRIEHYDVASPETPTHTVSFKREHPTFADLITAIVDPSTAGGIDPLVKYDYTSGGDLWKVHRLVRQDTTAPATYETVTFEYGNVANGAPPHYIISISDPRGVSVVTTEYYTDGPHSGRIEKITDAKGRATTFDYDTNPVHGANANARSQTTTDYLGNSTIALFDSRGNVTQTINSYNQELLLSYDEHNNVISKSRNGSDLTEFMYDLNGRLASEWTYVTSVQGQVSLITSKTYYNQFGQLTRLVDPNTYAANIEAVTTVNDYDDQGNLLATTDAIGNATSYSYFNTGPNIGRLEKVTDALQNKTVYQYDARGNVVSVTMQDSLNQPLSQTASTYDAINNRLSETRTRTRAGGAIDTITTTYRYDSQNRLIETIDALGHSSKTVYNNIGRVAATIDPLGRQTSFQYDRTGDLVQTTYPDGTISRTVEYTHSYTVSDPPPDDPSAQSHFDRRVLIAEDAHTTSEPNIKGTRTVYDRVGRVVQSDRVENIVMTVTLPSGIIKTEITAGNYSPIPNSATVTRYDPFGRVESVTDARGQVTSYQYDEVDRRISVNRKRDDSLPAIIEETKSEYDLNGNLTKTYMHYSYFDTGLQQMIDVHGSEAEYEYDDLNRRTKVIYPDIDGVHIVGVKSGPHCLDHETQKLS